MSAPSVMDALRAFLPDFLATRPVLSPPQRRAVWALNACRTPVLGGHVHACADCGERRFAWHSCHNRACPQCGRDATRQWVERELAKLVRVPYFMVTFTLPEELRDLFFGAGAKAAYDVFFAAASQALREKLAGPKWLGAQRSGFTMVLHTWNQRMGFHPHIHCIVPGGGLDAGGGFVRVKSDQFLLPVAVLSGAFRAHFREQLRQRGREVDPAVWRKDWGVHVQPFGTGENAVKYLGAYVARSVIADSRIAAVSGTQVTFRYKDRADGNAARTVSVEGVEFVRRYLRHVLPKGLRAVRYYGYCHPAAKRTRLKVAVLSGKRIELGADPAAAAAAAAPARHCACPRCQGPMRCIGIIPPAWKRGPAFRLTAAVPRGPPATSRMAAPVP